MEKTEEIFIDKSPNPARKAVKKIDTEAELDREIEELSLSLQVHNEKSKSKEKSLTIKLIPQQTVTSIVVL